MGRPPGSPVHRAFPLRPAPAAVRWPGGSARAFPGRVPRMQILHSLFLRYPLLSLAQTAFMVWMLIDAYRRRAEGYWFWVILVLPGLGSWAYFFVVKLPDLRGPNLGGLFQ